MTYPESRTTRLAVLVEIGSPCSRVYATASARRFQLLRLMPYARGLPWRISRMRLRLNSNFVARVVLVPRFFRMSPSRPCRLYALIQLRICEGDFSIFRAISSKERLQFSRIATAFCQSPLSLDFRHFASVSRSAPRTKRTVPFFPGETGGLTDGALL